nr:hypothetical protein Iba_chr01cCG5870 [Ipomoea batatas]
MAFLQMRSSFTPRMLAATVLSANDNGSTMSGYALLLKLTVSSPIFLPSSLSFSTLSAILSRCFTFDAFCAFSIIDPPTGTPGIGLSLLHRKTATSAVVTEHEQNDRRKIRRVILSIFWNLPTVLVLYNFGFLLELSSCIHGTR